MIPFPKTEMPLVSASEMAVLYEKLKTPKKLGAVMKWEKDMTDSATVFCKDGVFYMYFIAISKDHAVSGYETHLARSKDLVHFTVWEREPLVKSEFEWENRHAHKSWFLRHENRNYHFYCAVNDKNERFIALATS